MMNSFETPSSENAKINAEITLSQAANLMGVSHEFIERICADGILAAHALPETSQRHVRIQDVLALAKEKADMQKGHALIREALEL